MVATIDDTYRRDTERLLEFVRRGDLVRVDGKYRVTERGYRTASRYFRFWLRDSKFNDDSPPHNIDLLFLDGCTDVNIFETMHSCYGRCQWKRLHKAILGTGLSDEDKVLLKIEQHTPRPVKIPSWCVDLVQEMLKDARELGVGRNRLIEDGWGKSPRTK